MRLKVLLKKVPMKQVPFPNLYSAHNMLNMFQTVLTTQDYKLVAHTVNISRHIEIPKPDLVKLVKLV